MKQPSKPALLLVSLVALTFFGIAFPDRTASAAGISIAPLKYQTTLNGQIKKGAVDITNRSGSTQDITIQIQAFRQIDDKGTLQFYDNPLVSSGIIPDLTHFKLAPQQTEQLYFQLNGHNLPKKRIFAALLARAQPEKASYNITPVLRVGTLLIIKNGNGDPPKQGSLSGWNVSLFQFGNGVRGNFNFKNTEKGSSASGYFPNFTAELAGNTKKFSGNLVFPGIERSQSFNFSGSRIGVYNLKLTSDAGAGANQWVVVLTGYWRWLLPLIIIVLVVIVVAFVKYTKPRHRRPRL